MFGMDIQHGLTAEQTAHAVIARNWSSSPVVHARLACEYCFAAAENDAVENGATEAQESEWAALYISQEISSSCWRHES